MKIKKRCWVILPLILMIGFGFFALGTTAAAEEQANGNAGKKGVEYEAGFYYTIKKGDTLWDLSQRFNDSPWQWPDLWQENAQIPNPHWIYPGERIRLFRKKDWQQYQTPKMEVPAATPEVTATAPEPISTPEVYYWYPNMNRVGFIRKPAVQPVGEIFKSRDDKTLISKGDFVYLRYPHSGKIADFSPGMRLTVYRTMSPTDRQSDINTIGTQHLLLGVVEITKAETEYALAKVIQTYRAILIGDLVMPYIPRDNRLNIIDSTPGIEAKIINSEDHNKIMGELFVAFIDRGTDDQILPGQLYSIYEQESGPAGADGRIIPLEKRITGTVLVLLTEKTTSTVLITDCKHQVSSGQDIETP